MFLWNFINSSTPPRRHIDLYNVYGSCISGEAKEYGRLHSKAPIHRKTVGGPDACIDSIFASAYFNRPDVQRAFHVRKTTGVSV